jgi:phosphinothricin acetyltransferase
VTEVRAAVEKDLPRLTEIYNHYVVHTHVTFDVEPFTVEDRCDWFRHYAPHGRHRLLVGVVDGVVAGYATSSPYRPKPAYLTSVETSVYVAPELVGRGLGTLLYTELLALLAGEDVHRALAGIALPNDASIALHQRMGFVRVARFSEQGRKFDRYWDVDWFERPVP